MPRYKLTLSYDGTNYGGWQVQPNAVSIQSTLQEALKTLLKKETHATGSGRTDAGVHAHGQVAHFDAEDSLDTYKALHSINGLLPKEIRALSLEEVEGSFHARYSSKGKVYRYYLHLDRVQSPFNHLYSWHIPYKIDLEKLQKAASAFIGTHDFISFANESHKGAAAKDSVRTIKRIDITPTDGGIYLEFEGNGFLYKMVRNITGTLIEAATSKISKEEIDQLLLAKDRKKAGAAAPALGLFLMRVDYESS